MREPPRGTVTLLFTDIEGSTRLLQRLGGRYGAVLSDHHRLLRGAFEPRGGYEVGTQGDAFFVAFPNADAALRAAVEGQRALGSVGWEGDGEVAVRMGLHTGEPAIVAGDYVGLDVHRAARICAAAHGGQIVASDETRALVDTRAAGVELRDLGMHRLKDLDRSEHLWQVIAPGLRDDFPRLRSLEIPSNLPAQTTTFVGRARERRAVAQALGDGVRLLTLTGPGGTGKTRLALQAAADVTPNFHDGVFFVALAPLDEAGLVAPSIARSVGARETGSQRADEAVVEHLTTLRALLILDNFEHVMDAARLVSDLLAACPDLVVLVTSRTVLRINGEQEFHVPPLSGPPGPNAADSDAVALFVARARAVRPGFELTPENAGAVAEICARLDGLPLAIELAAARVKVLAPAAIVTRLGRRLELLSAGPRDAPARQRTLRGAIDWSYDLLDDPERKFFRGLAVFVGGWTLEGAEAVVGAAGRVDALDGIESLLDKSLIRSESIGEEQRYSMLALLREYAHERLDEAAEAEQVRRAHASYFVSLAEAAAPHLTGPDQAAWGRTLEIDHANIRAALEWSVARARAGHRDADLALRLATAMGRFWYVHGLVVEGSRWLEATLELSPEPGEQRAKALHLLGVLLEARRDHDGARAAFEASLEMNRRLGNPGRVAASLNSLGVTARSRGDLASARDLLAESLAVRRELRDEQGVTTTLTNLGCVAMDEGDAERAQALFEESLAIDRRRGDLWGVAVNASNISETALELGQPATAHARFEEAASLFRRLGDSDGLCECLERAACLAAVEGEARRAAHLAGAAEAARHQIGSPLAPADAERLDRRMQLAFAALGAEEYRRARDEGRAMTLSQALSFALGQPASQE